MKKTTYLLLIAVLLIAALTNGVNAQTFNNVTNVDSCDRISQFITISAAGANLKIETFWGDGNSNTTQLSNNQTSIWTVHFYNVPGFYTIFNILYKNNVPIDTFVSTHNTFCSYIYISTYLDSNNNCQRDINEISGRMKIDFEVDSAGTVIDTISVLGKTIYKANAPNTVYKFKALNTLQGANATCPSNGVITVTSPNSYNYINTDYGVQCGSNSQFDLGVYMIGHFRPVNISRIYIYPYNNACGSKSGVVTLHISNKYSFKSASPTPASVNGNIITWNFNNITVTNYPLITVEMDTATTVSINDTICNYVSITPISGDINTNNNTLTQCDEVRASWDPNDKHVYPAGEIMPGTKLQYTINFENLGNDTAFNIHVLDTLSQYLDRSTIEVISSSHDVTTTKVEDNGNDIIRFDFLNIHLADKSAPDHNKGYIMFTINAKQGLSPTTQIQNRAGIYFDINPVVITNYAENIIGPLSVNELSTEQALTLYPNPVTGVLTINTNNDDYSSLKVLNSMGQVMVQQAVEGKTFAVNMEHLPSGVYYIQLTGNDKSVTEKVEKL